MIGDCVSVSAKSTVFRIIQSIMVDNRSLTSQSYLQYYLAPLVFVNSWSTTTFSALSILVVAPIMGNTSIAFFRSSLELNCESLMLRSAIWLNVTTPILVDESPTPNESTSSFMNAFSLWYSRRRLPDASTAKPTSSLALQRGTKMYFKQ